MWESCKCNSMGYYNKKSVEKKTWMVHCMEINIYTSINKILIKCRIGSLACSVAHPITFTCFLCLEIRQILSWGSRLASEVLSPWFQHFTRNAEWYCFAYAFDMKKSEAQAMHENKRFFRFLLLAGNFIHMGNEYDFKMGGHRENKHFFSAGGSAKMRAPEAQNEKLHSIQSLPAILKI